MKLSKAIKPISYFKTHAAELIREINESNGTMIITQGGEAKVVVQDIREYEKDQEKMALLTMVLQSERSIRKGRTVTMEEAFKTLKTRRLSKHHDL